MKATQLSLKPLQMKKVKQTLLDFYLRSLVGMEDASDAFVAWILTLFFIASGFTINWLYF